MLDKNNIYGFQYFLCSESINPEKGEQVSEYK